jgi:beta-phosphoglucomutase-like phosphatase (HAD superfamily)
MTQQAADKLDLELGASVLFGDRPTDVRAVMAAGVGQNIFLPSSSDGFRKMDCNSGSSFDGAASYL